MASYFDEHDCEPTNPEEQYRQNALLELARSLMQGLDIDSGSFDLSDWDQRLPPPAAKAVVQSLPVVIISPEQADKALKCPVCLLEFEEQETVREMPCKHLFHTGCIMPWLSKSYSTRKDTEHQCDESTSSQCHTQMSHPVVQSCDSHPIGQQTLQTHEQNACWEGGARTYIVKCFSVVHLVKKQ
uniref:E3 ubiquitin-protein ligase RNF181 n=1 Tax=Cyprinus carpio carpio TaxID=630221 RepID=A0A9J8CAM5_CYPCA